MTTTKRELDHCANCDRPRAAHYDETGAWITDPKKNPCSEYLGTVSPKK